MKLHTNTIVINVESDLAAMQIWSVTSDYILEKSLLNVLTAEKPLISEET
jgi:hypothetical protein